MSVIEEFVRLLKVEKAIDVHNHLGRATSWFLGGKDEEVHFLTAEESMKLQDAMGITKAVCFPPSDPPYFLENDYCAEVVKKYPERFFGFVRINWFDTKTSLKEIEKYEHIPNYRGVKSFNQVSHGRMYGPRARPIFEKMLDLGWTVATIHPGLLYATAGEIDTTAEMYPDICFLVQHMGGPWFTDLVRIVQKRDNVYFENSETVPEMPINALRLGVPPDKIVFGSDTCYAQYYGTLPQLVLAMQVYGVPNEDQERILYKNAEKLLKTKA